MMLRIGRSRRLGHPVEEIADRIDDRVAGVDDVEHHQPGQHRRGDQNPDVEGNDRIHEPQEGFIGRSVVSPR